MGVHIGTLPFRGMKRVIEMQEGCRRYRGDVEKPKFTIHSARRRQRQVRAELKANKDSDKLRGIRPPMTAV